MQFSWYKTQGLYATTEKIQMVCSKFREESVNHSQASQRFTS